jgi:hypothetical protein
MSKQARIPIESPLMVDADLKMGDRHLLQMGRVTSDSTRVQIIFKQIFEGDDHSVSANRVPV